MASTTDRIEKKILLRAPQWRVWSALTNSAEFGEWFGVKFDSEFVPLHPISGTITNPPGYEHLAWKIIVDEIVPERLFSFFWHPYAVDPNVDYSDETPTKVTFELREAADSGTWLTLVESGFDKVPVARRAKAFEMNDNGWDIQMKRIETYVGSASGG
jgi:uncharacterized protein YndB with AHSA1/START domain